MAEIRLVSSPPLRGVIRELAPKFETATGHRLSVHIDAVAALKREIDAGRAFDVALLTPPLIDALISSGTIVSGMRANIARSGLGVVVKQGGGVPDVGSPCALKDALLGAQSILYASDSAVTTHIEGMFDRLGIASEVVARRRLLPAGGHVGNAVAAGVAALGLTHIPVILETSGVRLAGPFPAELQFYVDFCGGVSARSTAYEGAEHLLLYLASAEAVAAMQANGLERSQVGSTDLR